jgi:glycosyltransferase involved in cell wall biosynthesis
LRITFVRSNVNAVGEYRIKHPMQALEAMGHEVRLLTLDKTPQKVSNEMFEVDVLVLQRQTSMSAIELRDTLPGNRRPVTVYEVDDNPWEWHSWDEIHAELGYDYGRRVREVMACCDAITCSTRTLAERIRREFPIKPLWVVPNAIDFQLREAWSMKEDRQEHGLDGHTVLGWTGSIHHTRDGQNLLKSLPTVFDGHPEVVFLMQCDRSVYYEWTKPFLSAYKDRLRWVPPMPFKQHPVIYSLFDINLAPLEITPFNVCKSDLRLIEGGAHGVPYVASKIAPYLEFHRMSDGIGGFLADTPGQWVEAIESAIEQREARGQSLQRYVKETRSLEVVAGQWETAFKGAMEHGYGQEVKRRGAPERNNGCPCDSGVKYKKCCSPAYG